MKFFIIIFFMVMSLSLSLSLVDALTSVEESALFDIFVEILEPHQEVYVGEELFVAIKLVNFGEAGRIDVFLEYEIWDDSGKVVLNRKETVAVETQVNFIRDFHIAESTLPGSYIFYAKLIYADGIEADSQHSFDVKAVDGEGNYWILFWVLLGFIIVYLGFEFKKFWDRFLIKIRIKKIVKGKGEEGVY